MISRILKIAVLFIVFVTVVGLSAYLALTLFIKSEHTVVVPNLVGKNVVHVLEFLSDLGLNTKVKGSEYSPDVPKNHVISQEPEPGEEIKKGRDVRIILSKGTMTTPVPNLKGLSVQQSRIILEENGLCQGIMSNTYSSSLKKDEIIAQTPYPGTLVNRGECVNLLVSQGTQPRAYIMPDLIGLSLDQAIPLVERSDLVVEEIKSLFYEDKPENTIIRQDPLYGYRVPAGSSVSLIVNRKPGHKNQTYLPDTYGVTLFRYCLKNGFLKKHIRLRLNCYGVANDIYDELMEPGKEIWLLIPKNVNATVLLYEDDNLVKTEVFDAW